MQQPFPLSTRCKKTYRLSARFPYTYVNEENYCYPLIDMDRSPPDKEMEPPPYKISLYQLIFSAAPIIGDALMAWTAFYVRSTLRNLTFRLLPNLVCRIHLQWSCVPEIIFAKFHHFRFWHMYIRMYIFSHILQKFVFKDRNEFSMANIG